MPTAQVIIRTVDADCRAYVMSPSGGGPWPAVIFYGDAGGLRPAMLEMAKGLADAGYVVLLPHLFYRYGPYGPLVPKEVFKGDVGAILGPLLATTGNDKAAEDTGAFLAYLNTRKDVAGVKIGGVGFCMGGGMAIAAAATYPRCFAAVASFHSARVSRYVRSKGECCRRGHHPRENSSDKHATGSFYPLCVNPLCANRRNLSKWVRVATDWRSVWTENGPCAGETGATSLEDGRISRCAALPPAKAL